MDALLILSSLAPNEILAGKSQMSSSLKELCAGSALI